MHIAVIGAGGVGGNFGGRLAHAGTYVTFIARGAHLEALRANGLRVDVGNESLSIDSVNVTNEPAELGVVDVVLVCVKAWQVKDAADAMRPMIGEDTFVVPLQNGMDAPSELAAVIGPEHVLGGSCATVSEVVQPGHIRCTTGTVTFGELNNAPSERVERLRAEFGAAGIKAIVPPSIHVAMWTKFALITAWSGVGALTRAPVGVWNGLAETRAIFEAAVNETRSVAEAHGAPIPDADIERILALPNSLAPGALASMQRDILEGRPSELEYQNGAVVRFGQAVNVATPVHRLIYESLLPQEKRARGEIHFP